MTATASTLTVNVTPDLSGVAEAIKSSIASELRRLADELSPVVESPKPARYYIALDRVDDYWVFDRENPTLGECLGRDGSKAREWLSEVVSGARTMDPAGDITHWAPFRELAA